MFWGGTSLIWFVPYPFQKTTVGYPKTGSQRNHDCFLETQHFYSSDFSGNAVQQMTLTYNLENALVIHEDKSDTLNRVFSCSPLGVPLSPVRFLALDHIGCLTSTGVHGVLVSTITITVATDQYSGIAGKDVKGCV